MRPNYLDCLQRLSPLRREIVALHSATNLPFSRQLCDPTIVQPETLAADDALSGWKLGMEEDTFRNV